MTDLLCMYQSFGHAFLYPLTCDHTARRLPELMCFENEHGRTYEVRALRGDRNLPLDNCHVATLQREIREIVQNYYVVEVDGRFDRMPVMLSDGKLHDVKSVSAIVEIVLRSLAKHPDIEAHLSHCGAFSGSMKRAVRAQELLELASEMRIERGMCLPLSDSGKDFIVMSIESPTGEPNCFNATFYGAKDREMPTSSGQEFRRISKWQPYGSEEYKVAEAVIARLVRTGFDKQEEESWPSEYNG